MLIFQQKAKAGFRGKQQQMKIRFCEGEKKKNRVTDRDFRITIFKVMIQATRRRIVNTHMKAAHYLTQNRHPARRLS